MIKANLEEKSQINQEFQELKGQRGSLEEQWQQAAELASPRDSVFNIQRTEGQDLRTSPRIYDSKAERALERATAFYGAVLTPPDQQWHNLRSSLPELNKDHDVKLYFDEVTRILFSWRYRPRANFADQNHEEHHSLLGFGNSCMYVGSSFDQPLWYTSVHMSECFFSRDPRGLVDKVFRLFPMTVRQIIAEYGEENVWKEIKEKKPEEKLKVLHVVQPNPKYDPENRLDPMRRQYMSRHMLAESVSGATRDEYYLRTGGFFTFPFACASDSHSPGENYGRGTLQRLLPDIKMLNQIGRTYIRTGHFQSDPALLLKDDSSIDTPDLRPGKHVVGGLDAKGVPTIQPFGGGGSWEVNTEMLERTANAIEEGFLLDMFSPNFEGRDRVTATEVLEELRRTGRLQTPLAGRSNNQARSVQINRELQILNDRGLLPPMPGVLIEAGDEFEIEYTNPLALAQKTDGAIGAIRYVDQAMEKAQVNPEILDNVDFDAFIRLIHESEGAPTELVRDPEDVARMRQARQAQEQQQQLMEAAPGVGRAVLDGAKAQEIAQNV